MSLQKHIHEGMCPKIRELLVSGDKTSYSPLKINRWFRKNIPPPFSWSKSKPSKKLV
jgi:hypothetical protein